MSLEPFQLPPHLGSVPALVYISVVKSPFSLSGCGCWSSELSQEASKLWFSEGTEVTSPDLCNGRAGTRIHKSWVSTRLWAAGT